MTSLHLFSNGWVHPANSHFYIDYKNAVRAHSFVHRKAGQNSKVWLMVLCPKSFLQRFNFPSWHFWKTIIKSQVLLRNMQPIWRDLAFKVYKFLIIYWRFVINRFGSRYGPMIDIKAHLDNCWWWPRHDLQEIPVQNWVEKVVLLFSYTNSV